MSSAFKIRQVEANSPLLGRAAALHVKCLPGTLTSQRGAKTTAGLYLHLVRQGHAAHLALANDHLAGGIIVMRHACKQSQLFVVTYRPWSWLTAIRKMGISKTFTQLRDLIAVRSSTEQLPPHDYILALYVAESSRRLGVARALILHAIADAKSRGVGIAVDTTLANKSAKELYLLLGFVQSHQTQISIVFIKMPT